MKLPKYCVVTNTLMHVAIAVSRSQLVVLYFQFGATLVFSCIFSIGVVAPSSRATLYKYLSIFRGVVVGWGGGGELGGGSPAS